MIRIPSVAEEQLLPPDGQFSGHEYTHPCYKKSILGSKQPVSGNLFFCRFSLRLSENNRSRVKFMAKFGPTASNFGYIIFPIFG